MTQTDIANLALSKIGESLIDSIDDTGDRRARLAKLHYEPSLREILRAHFWGFAMTCPVLVSKSVQVIRITGTLTHNGNTVTFPDLVPATSGLWTSDGNTTAPATGLWYRFGHYTPIWTASIFEDGAETGFWESITDPDSPDGLELEPDLDSTGTATAAFATSREILPWTLAWQIPADMLKLRKLIDAEGNKIDQFARRRITGTQCFLTRDLASVSAEFVTYVSDPAEFDPLFTAAFVTLLAARLARAISGSEKNESDLLSLYQSVDLPAARTADGHDAESNENHPLQELVAGSLTGLRSSFFPEDL